MILKNLTLNFSDDLKTVLVKHIGASEIHKQCAISFSTPMFPDQKITQEIQVKKYNYRIYALQIFTVTNIGFACVLALSMRLWDKF